MKDNQNKPIKESIEKPVAVEPNSKSDFINALIGLVVVSGITALIIYITRAIS